MKCLTADYANLYKPKTRYGDFQIQWLDHVRRVAVHYLQTTVQTNKMLTYLFRLQLRCGLVYTNMHKLLSEKYRRIQTLWWYFQLRGVYTTPSKGGSSKECSRHKTTMSYYHSTITERCFTAYVWSRDFEND